MAIDFSDLGAQPVNQGIDFSDLGGKKIDQPTSLGDKLGKAVQFIDNPGYAIRGETPPTVNDMDAGNPMTSITNAFDKAGNWVADKVGQAYPKSPYPAAIAGTATAILGNPITTASPGGDSIPLPGSGTAEDMAQNAGRRALGYTKGMLKKPGTMDTANATAQTMLDQGVIRNPLLHPFSSGAEAIQNRAQDLADKSGQAVGNTISALGKSGAQSIDTNAVGSQVLDQLSSKYQGGAYDAQNNIAKEIADTIGAHGNGPISFESAQALKQKLYDLANFNSSSDAMKANMYKQASGIVNDAINKSVESASKGPGINPELYSQYIKNKQVYGASKNAEKALLNRVSSESGNKRIGLTDVIAGGAELANGNPGAAAILVGVKHGLENLGNATTATLADAYAKSKLNPNLLRNLLSGYMSPNSQGRQE